MINYKKTSDRLLTCGIVIFIVGVLFYKLRPVPSTSADNPSIVLFAAWGFSILIICGISSALRLYYLFVHRPKEKLYHIYALLLSMLPFLFYWNISW
jgi:hypothetical protein